MSKYLVHWSGILQNDLWLQSWRSWLHASLHDTPCVINFQDADVLVLIAYGYKKKSPVSNWFMQYDTDTYADIRKIVEHLGDHITSSLPQLHALTGCDTTSYFFNHGNYDNLKKGIEEFFQNWSYSRIRIIDYSIKWKHL